LACEHADKIKGLFGSGGDTGQFKKDLEDANKSYVPMRFDPGTSKTKVTPISLSLNVDGRTLAQSISEQLEQLYELQPGRRRTMGNRTLGELMAESWGLDQMDFNFKRRARERRSRTRDKPAPRGSR